MKPLIVSLFFCLVLSTSVFAGENRTVPVKKISFVGIDERKIHIGFQTERVCGPGYPSGAECFSAMELAELLESPNKNAMFQMLINAYSNKIPVVLTIGVVGGVTTILSVAY